MAEFKSNAVLPYVQGVSEPFSRCPEQQGISTISKSDRHLDHLSLLFTSRTINSSSFKVFHNSETTVHSKMLTLDVPYGTIVALSEFRAIFVIERRMQIRQY